MSPRRTLRLAAVPKLSFLMTDYVIRRHGFTSLPDHFRGLSAGRGRYEGFRHGFGQDLGEFEREVLEHLRQVLR